MDSLTDQIRRASKSIGAQLAEAWAKRRYPKHWMSNLTDADGEQMETQHWLTEAFDCQYLNKSEFETFTAQCEGIGRILDSTISKTSSFTSDECVINEEPAVPDLLIYWPTDY